MQKIHPSLESEIRANSKAQWQVLIILKEGVSAETVGIRPSKQLSESIISATFTSEDILALAKKPEIIAIEPDEEVHAL